jgi:hypothetical protein
MASSESDKPRSDLRLLVAQVAGAWLCGSAFMGTVALLFLISERALLGPPGPGPVPLIACPPPVIPGPCGYPSLFLLTPVERLAVFALVTALFVSLAVLIWRTTAASWLAGDTRGRLLWVLVVALGGLAGWSYAAVVTFAVGFSPVTQVVLGYTAGGLPFGLVAGTLLRPWRANIAALGVSAGLVIAGLLMVAGRHPGYPQNVFTLYAEYARSFFSRGRIRVFLQ